MPFDEQWMFPWLDIFRHNDNHFYFMVANLLVRGPIKIEAIKARSSGGMQRHVQLATMPDLPMKNLSRQKWEVRSSLLSDVPQPQPPLYTLPHLGTTTNFPESFVRVIFSSSGAGRKMARHIGSYGAGRGRERKYLSVRYSPPAKKGNFCLCASA
jgi:hypothetical protein